MALRKENPLPQFKVASYKCLGIRLSFEDPTTLLPGGGWGWGRKNQSATKLSKNAPQVRNFLNSFVQDCRSNFLIFHIDLSKDKFLGRWRILVSSSYPLVQPRPLHFLPFSFISPSPKHFSGHFFLKKQSEKLVKPVYFNTYLGLVFASRNSFPLFNLRLAGLICQFRNEKTGYVYGKKSHHNINTPSRRREKYFKHWNFPFFFLA